MPFLFNKAFVEFIHSQVDEHYQTRLSQVFIFIFELSNIVLRIIQLLFVDHLWESESNMSEYFHNDYECPSKVLFSTVKKMKLKVERVVHRFNRYSIQFDR
jgi:hypothetical protein